ncbi:Crp/Fnr family transcriptional regulator [Noviherbaspirillum galbum]|uniref:Helix-turn-helix domain-containing protein n=1 Tax=Noviherbaspirillum galbum TaxID=2709383 RepID=A0A6B3SHR9_9BURK|nr:helix-turn-helix domain-containing protein [Noviherbaspirillum galbum]NEX60228.1 helix-turn-helix domain-containing protein [Noviherbaspirillum galbum]
MPTLNESDQSDGAALVTSRSGKLWSTLAEVCALLRLPVTHAIRADDTHFHHMHYRTGQRIHSAGQPFEMLYVVHGGFLKSAMIDDLGNEQILSFPMRGDVFGVDGMHNRRYGCETVAMSSCDIILVPFKTFTELGKRYSELDVSSYEVLSRHLMAEQARVVSLGSLSAEARVARFLLQLSDRFAQLGFSGRRFNLFMTRAEMGNYLGLTLETVSRTLSAFNELGYLSVDMRAIDILAPEALRTLRRLPPSHQRTARKTAPTGQQ